VARRLLSSCPGFFAAAIMLCGVPCVVDIAVGGSRIASASEMSAADPDSAVESLLIQVSAKPADATLWYNLGCAYLSNSLYPEALHAFAKSIQIGATFDQAKENYFRLFKSKFSTAYVEAADLIRTSHVGAYHWSGVICWVLAWLIAIIVFLRSRTRWLAYLLPVLIGLVGVGLMSYGYVSKQEQLAIIATIDKANSKSSGSLPHTVMVNYVPSELAKAVYDCAPGSFVKVIRKSGDWVRIKLLKRSVKESGWVRRDQILLF